MKALFCGLVCLIGAGMAAGQANSQPELKSRANQVQDLQPGDDTSSIPPDAPVITINGACDKGTTTGADCKTVITRQEFEKIMKAVQPNLPKPQQKQLAIRYVSALLMAQKAHELGLDKGPDFDEQMHLARLQLTAGLARQELQKEASKVSDQEISEYYNAHTSDFRTITYERIYVPKQKSMDTTAQKPNDPNTQKNRDASEADMKAEADKLRARAATGEDFIKLQQEAYDFAGMKLKANTTPVSKVRKTAMSQPDQAIFDLKKGDVSQVISDPQGHMIYKVEDFQDLPLADVREEVSQKQAAEKIKKLNDSYQKISTTDTTYDPAYFASPTAPTLRNPGESAPPSGGAPAPQPPGKN